MWIALVPVAALGVAGTMLFARGLRSMRPWHVRLRMRLLRR